MIGWGLAGCVFIVSISALWGALAGIKTVIWTDFLLFLLFASGAIFALLYTLGEITKPLPEIVLWLDQQAKLVLFDFDTDVSKSTISNRRSRCHMFEYRPGGTQGTWQR